MMEIVAELSNLDYKPFSVMCKKGHHPQNVQCPLYRAKLVPLPSQVAPRG